MPHIDITMYPGRDDKRKKEIAERVQDFISKEMEMDKKFVTVSIEDVPVEEWDEHMASMTDKKMFV